ncbi:MAG: hypothetical protein GOVbin709_54 [Prokaryotic dsDNA virus sp.]|nr:MAG: hypothetical protein GOVbin709_54 [Prokaryotic dsDNA virus sp.]|tara:strand:- start:3463 stop:4761 length:1299 start_codon:yes stop_codon:yes gene_type:complete
MNIFNAVLDFAERNHYVDVADKLPVFLCSVGSHIFNALNKCSRCDFDPDSPLVDEDHDFTIPNCPLRHNNMPFYTPMSQLPDTRIHILMRGAKGSGKSVMILMFLAEGTGLLHNQNEDMGQGMKTMMGANSITEAGMFGSVDEEGEIAGRPIAREMCGGFLGFEEFSSMSDASKKDHSMDMKNQLLTSLDNGRVQKALRNGWVRYTTRYTVWAGTQPARFELDSGLDRRFFIIDIDMTPEKELLYKKAQHLQSNMSVEERTDLATKAFEIKQWLKNRMETAVANPPTGILFDDDIGEWINRPDVRSYEADLFRRLAIGYHMMQPIYRGGEPLVITLDPTLENILNMSLQQRRTVMDADLELIRSTFWKQDLPKSQLLKEISRMITQGDYQSAKRWVIENLEGQSWYFEYEPETNRRGRKGMLCRIGPQTMED